MACLRNSQCKLKLLHLPAGAYIEFFIGPNNKTVYPIDTFHVNYAKWINYTLVRGKGTYIPYATWVIETLCGLYKNTIKEHFVIEYD